MTCYKLVTAEFKWFGVQTRVESFIMKAERRLFTNFHRYLNFSLQFAQKSLHHSIIAYSCRPLIVGLVFIVTFVFMINY